jgi:uncharacterized protein (DUF608 family)
MGAFGEPVRSLALPPPPPPGAAPQAAAASRQFSAPYAGPHLNRVAFPLGGLGAGMICLEGTGALSHASLRHRPDVFNEPCAFAAISIRGAAPVARVLEGPVPAWKLYGSRGSARGAENTSFGLPRCGQVEFASRFPFATVKLADEHLPLQVELTGWSPFTPGDADNSSLPVAALEYRFTNRTAQPVAAVFSYNSANFLTGRRPTGAVRATPGGFVLWMPNTPEAPADEASFAATVDDPAVQVNHAWFRGGWRDPLTMAWRDVETAACFARPPLTEGPPATGASLFVPFHLAPGASRTIVLRLCWHVPKSALRFGRNPATAPGKTPAAPAEYYRPWYAARFAGIADVAAYWASNYAELRRASTRFADCLFDNTLPPEVNEAVTANLAILKSPTVLRQADGRMWAWEGCNDDAGCCAGSCTHVWNYAQAVAHLFPSLERSLRDTEFGESLDERGHQVFRASLPIRPADHSSRAAADGQLGGILKVYRDWRIGGDTAWLRGLWPHVRRSLDYCTETWDPGRKGWLEEPHHNTYDIEFWGPDGMCGSIYLAALQAAVGMGRALGDEVGGYEALFAAGRKRIEAELFDGEYFFQKIEWKNLRADVAGEILSSKNPPTPEALALIEKEGPKYQYGTGCLSDGVIGAWFALVCGVGPVLDQAKVTSHLRAVHRHNLKKDLSTHANPQRPSYAAGAEGGLLLCSWPKGGKPSLPFVYSDEVWTGIEYQVASHLIMLGQVDEGLEIVRNCRARYDGRVRDPFNEYECGHWYARALASYALLQALSGARYDGLEQVLYLAPPRAGDFRCFLATATGYGTVGVRAGKPFLEVRSGTIPLLRINYSPVS